ncbi:hypothetical protein BH10CHL1_BH10CHL1_33980 [soil metagenome]
MRLATQPQNLHALLRGFLSPSLHVFLSTSYLCSAAVATWVGLGSVVGPNPVC